MATKNSNPNVMVVQSTQDRSRRNAFIELNGSEGRGILVQGKMRSDFVVQGNIAKPM